MSAEGDSTPDLEALARAARARAANAPLADDIRTLADHAIGQVNALADEAIGKAREVDALMKRLAHLLEHDDEKS